MTPNLPNTLRGIFSRVFPAALLALCGCLATTAQAQSPASGVIAGQISNAATAQNLEGVRVQVSGSNREALSDRQGFYELTGLPPGDYTLTFNYPGLDQKQETVTVDGAHRVQRNIALNSNVYVLEKFNVAGEREGNAAAIVAQKNAVNVQNVVTADAFGSIAKGNVGNFLRRLPGIAGTTDEIDTENIILRGMSSEFTSLDIDGVRYASGGTSRSQSALGMPADMIERIEVIKSPTPDTPADSLGGRINMVTKDAYDRQGRSFGFRVADSYSFTYGRAVARNRTSSIAPALAANYADVYQLPNGQKLGIYASTNWERIMDVRGTTSWDNFTTVSNVSYARYNNGTVALHGVDRGGALLKADYKVSNNFSFGTKVEYNLATNVMFRTRAQIKSGTVRPTFSNPDYSFSVVDGANYGTERSDRDRLNNHIEADVHAKYKSNGGLEVKFDLDVQRATQRDHTNFFNATSNRKFNYVFDRRKGFADYRWPAIRMLSDYYTGSATTTTALPPSYLDINPFSDDFRDTNTTSGLQFQRLWSKNEIVNAKLDATKVLDWRFPIELKTGLFHRIESIKQSRSDLRGQMNLAASGFGPDLRSLIDRKWDLGGAIGRYPVGVAIDIDKMMQASGIYYKSEAADPIDEWGYDPTKFTIDQSSTRQNTLQNSRKIWERVSAAYIQGTSKFGRLSVTTGVRVEHADVKRNQMVRDRTKTGTLAEFTGRHWSDASYDNVFPSIHTRYSITPNLVAHTSYGTTSARPNWGNILSNDDADDNAHTISVPNLDLKPRTSENYDLSLEYYFEPVGVISVGVFEKDIKNFDANLKIPISLDEARDLGAQPDPAYAGQYILTTRRNVGSGRVRGFEFNYSQSLSFLPGLLRGFGVFANFTYNQTRGTFDKVDSTGFIPLAVSTNRLEKFIPRTANAGVSYVYSRVDLRAQWNFTDDWPEDTPTDPATTKIRGARWSIDMNGKYRLTKNFSLFADAVNITTNHGKKYRGWVDDYRRNETNALAFLLTAGVQGSF